MLKVPDDPGLGACEESAGTACFVADSPLEQREFELLVPALENPSPRVSGAPIAPKASVIICTNHHVSGTAEPQHW